MSEQDSEPLAQPITAQAPAGSVKPKKEKEKPPENKVVRLLEKHPLGMTLPEMAGGPRQVKKIKTLRPLLAEAIKLGLIMPISQRAGATVYQLVKFKSQGLR